MSGVVIPIQTRSMHTMSIEEAIVGSLDDIGPCVVDDLVLALDGYTWNEVFMAVDRMSRNEELILEHPDRFTIRVSLPDRTLQTLRG